jgi:hypothetical protein
MDLLRPLIKSHSAKKLPSKSRNSLSTRSLHRQFTIEKDQLYLEYLALKVQLNSVNDDNFRLKAKVTQLKKDLDKANEVIVELNGQGRANTSQLVYRLKHLINALKTETSSQKAELTALKKKIRVTQYIELETEKQVYVSECMRLTRQLEQTMRPFTRTFFSPEPPEDTSSKRTVPSKKPKKRQSLSAKKPKPEIKRSIQEQLAMTQKQLKQTKEALELERRSRQDITSRSRDRSPERPSVTPDTLANSFIEKLHTELTRNKKDLGTVVSGYSYNDQLTAKDFYEQLNISGLSFSEDEVQEMWRGLFKESKVSVQFLLTILQKDNSVLPSPFLISGEKHADFSDIRLSTTDQSEVERDEVAQHIALRMQLHRVACGQAVQLMSEVMSHSPKTQSALLSEEPFDFRTQEERSRLLKLLKTTSSLDELADQLGNWSVLEDSEEQQFDSKLAEILGSVKDRLASACERYDRDQTGVVSLSEFLTAAKSCGVEFEPQLKMYIRLLSYSFQHKLDSAPYISLIEAFAKSSGDESSLLADISEDEQEQIVTKILRDILRTINRLGVNLSAVFKTSNGLITPKGLLEGLNTLLVKSLKKREFLVLLATLQSDKYEEPLVEFSDLEAFIQQIEGSLSGNQPDQFISLLDTPEDPRTENKLFEVRKSH